MSVDSRGTVRVYDKSGKVLDMLVPGSVQNVFNLVSCGRYPTAHKIECHWTTPNIHGQTQCLARRDQNNKWEFLPQP